MLSIEYQIFTLISESPLVGLAPVERNIKSEFKTASCTIEGPFLWAESAELFTKSLNEEVLGTTF